MKLKAKAIFETFTLESDPDGAAEVVVRQAREGENIERNQLLAKTSYSQNAAGETSATQDINPSALRRKEAYLTLGRATGFLLEDEKGNEKELFKSKETEAGPSVKEAMSEREFIIAWNNLPPEMAREISQFVYKVNPDWDPTSPGE